MKKDNWSVILIIPLILLCSFVTADQQGNLDELVNGNNSFAFDLYRQIESSEGNLFFSPYSISSALAMTYAGARGNTEKEMAKTLKFTDQQKLHPAFSDLAVRLNKVQEGGHIELSIANSLWPQAEYEFLDSYLELTKAYYGVAITPVDYKNSTEAARQMINHWVEDKTKQKIKDLIKPGVLDPLTRLVLANAIYFKGNWKTQFQPDRTKDAPFHVSPTRVVQVPMMSQKENYNYADLGTLSMIELPYIGEELAMIILLPKENDGIDELESGLSAESLVQMRDELRNREILVYLPKFKMTSGFRLDKNLISMGMADAFNPRKADFSGMDGRPDWLYIGAVIHKAFVEVNEEGTEAAAATAVVMKARGLPKPPPVFRADHPFIFLIHQKRTGSILFMGRVTDPTKAGKQVPTSVSLKSKLFPSNGTLQVCSTSKNRL